jgi:Bacterial Ig domain
VAERMRRTGRTRTFVIGAALVLAIVSASSASSAFAKPGGGKNCPTHGRCDVTPPTISISLPDPGTTVSGTVSVVGTAADNVGLQAVSVEIDGASPQPATGTTSWTDSVDTTGSADGTHTLTAIATDAAGNIGTASLTIGVTNATVASPSPSPSATPTPSPSPTSSPSPMPTLAPGLHPAAGSTVVDPIIDCNADPVSAIGNAIGIVVDASNVTIVNPSIRECDRGIEVRKNASGVMPTNVRIVADADYPGYQQTNFTLDRAAISWRAGNGEIGDVSAPTDQVGGQMSFVDDFRSLSSTLTTGFRMHHTSSTCILPCPTYSGADSPGAHWGIKFIADRTYGAPFEASNVRIDHNFVQGFDDEGISFDARSNTPSMRLSYAAGSVAAVSPADQTLSLSGIPTTENTVGMWVRFNTGVAAGDSVQIRSRSGDAFVVGDPTNVLSTVRVGDLVTVGGRFWNELVDHNTIDAFHATAAKSGFNTSLLLDSTISDNLVYDTPDFAYPSSYHLESTHQCIMVRSQAGPGGIPDFSFGDHILRNTCQDAGDISVVVCSMGTYEVQTPAEIADNVFVGSPLGVVWRYKSPPL